MNSFTIIVELSNGFVQYDSRHCIFFCVKDDPKGLKKWNHRIYRKTNTGEYSALNHASMLPNASIIAAQVFCYKSAQEPIHDDGQHRPGAAARGEARRPGRQVRPAGRHRR